MVKWVAAVVLIFTIGFLGYFYWSGKSSQKVIDITSIPEVVKLPKPLEKYTFENLSKTPFEPSKIEIGEVLQEDPNFISFKFYFWVDGKKVSGLLNVPKTAGEYPVVVMIRGYVDKEIYQTGIGTQRGGEVFAKFGFVTLAPDFLGYGDSDNPSENSFEERFQTYTTMQTLLASIGNLNGALDQYCHSEFSSESKQMLNQVQHDTVCIASKSTVKVDDKKVGIWGHSNGGQIALSTLAISQKPYPTVLWAPVSKPFPYSILYYTDEFDDKGKLLRKALANFEEDYDVELYNPMNFLSQIKASVQIHQGFSDAEIPTEWTIDLEKALKLAEVDAELFTYPGADHNMQPGWDSAISRSVQFFKRSL